jgi:hypothetical protein
MSPPQSSTTTTTTASTPSQDDATASKVFFKVVKWIKATASMVLTIFCVIVVSAAICTKQTVATGEYNVHPIVALVIFWGSLSWLAILEGGLNAMVGLQPINKDLYKDTHRKAYLCTSAAHKGQNLERFIVGRQYLDLTIVFTASFMVNAVDGAQVLGLPKLVTDIFLGSDLGVILCTIVFGQLVSVINCSHSMLDFINNWCMVGSTRIALFVESTGILHAVYLVQIIFTKVATRARNNKEINSAVAATAISRNKSLAETSSKMSVTVPSAHVSDTEQDTNSSDPGSAESVSNTTPISSSQDGETELNKSIFQRVFFWARILMSLGMSIYTVVVFSTAIIGGNTGVRDSIPKYVSFLALAILLFLGGFMEALQIALFAVKHLPTEQIETNDRAKRICEYMFQKSLNEEGSVDVEIGKFRSFLIGRQIAQTVIMFMIARIINVDMKVEGETLFGVSMGIQTFFFDSGLLNALLCAIFASLSWRVTANFFPLVYLGSPISIWIIRLCLLVEGTGICESAWVLAKIPDMFVRFKSDDYYFAKAQAAAIAKDDLEVGEEDEENVLYK